MLEYNVMFTSESTQSMNNVDLVTNGNGKATLTMTGTPKPPFRMIAPNGAPIRKNSRQAIDKVNFL